MPVVYSSRQYHFTKRFSWCNYKHMEQQESVTYIYFTRNGRQIRDLGPAARRDIKTHYGVGHLLPGRCQITSCVLAHGEWE